MSTGACQGDFFSPTASMKQYIRLRFMTPIAKCEIQHVNCLHLNRIFLFGLHDLYDNPTILISQDLILVTGWAKAGGSSGRVLAVYRGMLKYAPKVSPAPKVWGELGIRNFCRKNRSSPGVVCFFFVSFFWLDDFMAMGWLKRVERYGEFFSNMYRVCCFFFWAR